MDGSIEVKTDHISFLKITLHSNIVSSSTEDILKVIRLGIDKSKENHQESLKEASKQLTNQQTPIIDEDLY